MKRNSAKKMALLALAVGTSAWVLLGCNASNKITPAGPSAPLALGTPTPNLTPVCGMTPVTLTGGMYALSNAGIHVLHNAAEYDAFVAATSLNFISLTPVPTATPAAPPVDFSQQMIVTAGMPQPCDNTTLTLTNVCVGPTQVTINATYDTCGTCPQCNVASMYASVYAVAVPQSSLPVSIVASYITH